MVCGVVVCSGGRLNLCCVGEVVDVVVVLVLVVVVGAAHGWAGVAWGGVSGKWLMPPRITGYCKLVIVVLVAARPTVVMSRRGNE